MSGISENGHNKFHTCQGCPDRSVEPNCHTTCQGYLFRREKYDKISAERHKDWEVNEHKKDAVHKNMKRYGKWA